MPGFGAPAGWAAFARMFLNPRRTWQGCRRMPGWDPIFRSAEGLLEHPEGVLEVEAGQECLPQPVQLSGRNAGA